MRIRLIHWNPDEGRKRARILDAEGVSVDFEPFTGETLKQVAGEQPEAVVIDLTRMPSQGRDVAVALRIRKSTRHIPLVFAGGAGEKVAGVRGLLPDAVYSSWEDILGSLDLAVKKPPADPVVPSSQFAGYSGKSLPEKLGISGETVLLLLDPPHGFERTLGPLPGAVTIRKRATGKASIVILFARSTRDLENSLQKAKRLLADGGSLWIAWQKKTSGAGSDLTQASVRRKGLDSGLVDYKICSIDDTWSGLRFALRGK
jgi:hypothetical protein